MPNLPIAGFGQNPTIGGFGGSGIPTGSACLVQNPSFEIPGVGAGEASNWTVSIIYSLEEYATFARPGSALVVDRIPATLPELGFTIVSQPDGSVIIYQAAEIESAQEDFEEGWASNEDFKFVLQESVAEKALFGARRFENFEDGWLNDPGFLNNFNALSSDTALFETVSSLTSTFEDFSKGWPTAIFDGVHRSSFPRLAMGKWLNVGAGTYTDLAAYAGPNAAYELKVVVLQSSTIAYTLTIEYLDINLATVPAIVTVPANTPVGTVLHAISLGAPELVDVLDVIISSSITGGEVQFEGDIPAAVANGLTHETTGGANVFTSTLAGVENFESGWNSNDTYVSAFIPSQLDSSGFDVGTTFGALNLNTNVYTDTGATLVVADPKLLVRVTATDTGIPLETITITYVNQAGTGGRTGTVVLPPSPPLNMSFIASLQSPDTGVKDVTAASRSAAAPAGTLDFYVAAQTVEDFENNWEVLP